MGRDGRNERRERRGKETKGGGVLPWNRTVSVKGEDVRSGQKRTHHKSCGALYYPFTHLQPFRSKRLNLGPQKVPRRKDLYLKPGGTPPLPCEPVSLLQTAP